MAPRFTELVVVAVKFLLQQNRLKGVEAITSQLAQQRHKVGIMGKQRGLHDDLAVLHVAQRQPEL
ncbi:MAG: hypothetical protein CV089_02280 [Nitrospira sp. WS110]|nr:hypothetical protein [Nitrospira sp. WS110]